MWGNTHAIKCRRPMGCEAIKMTEKRTAGRPKNSFNKVNIQKAIKDMPEVKDIVDLAQAGLGESIVTLFEILQKRGKYKDASVTNVLQAAKELKSLGYDLLGDQIKEQFLREKGESEKLTPEEEKELEEKTKEEVREQTNVFSLPRHKG